MASADRGPGGNRLAARRSRRKTNGAVGVLLDADIAPTSLVSQGCRPIGQPFIVTRAERNVIYELAGRPALERLLRRSSNPSDPKSGRWPCKGLHLGLVVDEHKATFDRGRLPRSAACSAPIGDRAPVAVGDDGRVGTDHPVPCPRRRIGRRRPARSAGRGRPPSTARWCSRATGGARTCSAQPHHDAVVVSRTLHRPLPWQACSAPARSAQWAGATSCTVSPLSGALRRPRHAGRPNGSP